MRSLARVAQLVLTTSDIAAATRPYAHLLNCAANLVGDGPAQKFDLANISLVIQPGDDSGLARLMFAVGDLERARMECSRCGLPTSSTGPHEAALDPEATHGLPIALTDRLAPVATATCGIVLDHVVIRTPNPERAIALYGGRLGLDMRLDRSNPAWNARLLFFRCGDLVVEIAHVLSEGLSDGPDRFGGLSWRVPDIDAAHARLSAAGFALSPVRAGRRPGSRVCTVRDGTAGVPTILLGLDAVARAAE